MVRNVTFAVCTIAGGIGSELMQHVLAPYRSFDLWDIAVNMAGSASAIVTSGIYHHYFLKRQKRQRKARPMNWNLESRIGMHFDESDIEDTDINIPLNNIGAGPGTTTAQQS
ncbi:hypothetical protein OGATHE_005101 [Ogataea polymorpha]|uniref:VanZ-like domain-containing protein n=1 Tax=Ogataea polymorpha TaxID=460523 RepID=A0A9P8T038_9ASCO|nr:hypothetical protein OGATHE_005101 [Ogataea polymorpha]